MQRVVDTVSKQTAMAKLKLDSSQELQREIQSGSIPEPTKQWAVQLHRMSFFLQLYVFDWQ